MAAPLPGAKVIRCVVFVLACALGFAACVRIVDLTPVPDAHRVDDSVGGPPIDAGIDALGDAFVPPIDAFGAPVD